MYKVLLNYKQVDSVVRKCYATDLEHMRKWHMVGDQGFEACVAREVGDYIFNNIKIFGVYNDSKLLGYFGEELCNGERCLTGFCMIPEAREQFLDQYWDMIINHFNKSFKVSVFDNNIPASKFLMKKGCKLIKEVNSRLLFEYKENP